MGLSFSSDSLHVTGAFFMGAHGLSFADRTCRVLDQLHMVKIVKALSNDLTEVGHSNIV
jgi:hypothetical protein